MFKVITLDFWGTLAEANPDYAKARTELLVQTLGMTTEESAGLYLRVKHLLDGDAEASGKSLTPITAMRRLLDHTNCSNLSAASMSFTLQKLAVLFPPRIPDGMLDALSKLRSHGLLVGVASNTNFLGGEFVQGLVGLKSPHTLDFSVSSDLVGASKPSRDFFDMVNHAVSDLVGEVATADILHIGDNAICDGDGAKNAGMSCRITKSPAETLSILHGLLTEHQYA